MACVMVSAKCHSCETVFDEFWVNRDVKGSPNFEGLVCPNCSKRNTIRIYWPEMKTAAHTMTEDGEIKRFEYSYTNPEGKKIEKSIPAHHITEHLKKKEKKNGR